MAGGAKETPRQRMIGIMYLVLMAMLALQVSNTVLEKFLLIDESLQQSIGITTRNNDNTIGGIEATVEKNGNRPKDREVVTKAKDIRAKTQTVLAEIQDMRSKVEEYAEWDEEKQEYKKASDYDRQMQTIIGIEGKKNGSAYALENTLNQYSTELNAMLDTTIFEALAKPGRSKDGVKQDWAYTQFDHAPNVSVLAILSQIKSEVLQSEAKALEILAARIGADQLKFDRIFPVVRPYSKVIAAGTKYEADMFIAAANTSQIPTMTFNGQPVKDITDGIGKISFTASGGGYDKEGNAKKSWKGSIGLKTPNGDTVLTFTEEYIVAKPVVSIQAAAVQALYLNCGNELNVQVPALGSTYDPSFQASGASTISGGKKGFVTVIPSKPKVALTVFSNGNKIETVNFNVKAVPKPNIVPLAGNRPADLKNGVSSKQMPRSIALKAIADEDFKSFLPKDARYRVTGWEVTLARGKRAIGNKRVRGESVSISDFAQKAKPGDRMVIEVKQVTRLNFRDQKENVKGMSSLIYTIPIS